MRFIRTIEIQGDNQVYIMKSTEENILKCIIGTVINNCRIEGARNFSSEEQRERYFQDFGVKNDHALTFFVQANQVYDTTRIKKSILLPPGINTDKFIFKQ